MSEANLTVSIHQLDGGGMVVGIVGDVTPAADEILSSAHRRTLEACANPVVLDFSGLDYLNSGGIGLLVTLLVRAQRAKQQLVAVGLDDHYREIFSLTRIDEAIQIHDSLEEVST